MILWIEVQEADDIVGQWVFALSLTGIIMPFSLETAIILFLFLLMLAVFIHALYGLLILIDTIFDVVQRNRKHAQ